MLDLALLDQLLDGPRNVFDGHVRIDPVLVERSMRSDPEPLERGLDDLLDVLRSAVQARQALRPALGTEVEPELVAITTCPRKGARALLTTGVEAGLNGGSRGPPDSTVSCRRRTDSRGRPRGDTVCLRPSPRAPWGGTGPGRPRPA